MRLTPHEQERLMIHVAAGMAKDRRARGLRLNQPEAVAMLSSFIFEGARDGRTVSDLMDAGRHVLCVDDVMEGIADLVPEVQVEATFPDGTKLVTLHDPIGPGTPGGAAGSEAGEMAAAPGTVWTPDQPIVLNLGRGTLHLVVVNAGDRPIQVGSHYHFAEANPGLEFDRQAAHGHRLDIPAGTAVRFEPGVNRTVDLVPLTGTRTVWGLRGEVAGPLDDPIVHTSTREPTDG